MGIYWACLTCWAVFGPHGSSGFCRCRICDTPPPPAHLLSADSSGTNPVFAAAPFSPLRKHVNHIVKMKESAARGTDYHGLQTYTTHLREVSLKTVFTSSANWERSGSPHPPLCPNSRGHFESLWGLLITIPLTSFVQYINTYLQ